MADLFLTEAWPQLKVLEGGYSNDATDAGGETLRGISRNRHPNWVGWHVIDAMKGGDFPANTLADPALDQMVIAFYRAEFWASVGADDMPPALALEVFDCGVNCGQATAVKFVQRVLNVMNNGATLYPDVNADGRWGRGTQSAMNGYLQTRGDLSLLIVAFNCLRGAYYVECAEKREANEKYEFGWFKNRIGLSPKK